MASGMGTRFGGNKLMAKLNGIPLIQYVIQATESRFEQRVVVTRHNDVTKLCHELDVAVALHNKPHRNDTVRLGMRPRAIPLLDIRRTANAPIRQRRRLCRQTAQRVSEMHQGFKQMGTLRC